MEAVAAVGDVGDGEVLGARQEVGDPLGDERAQRDLERAEREVERAGRRLEEDLERGFKPRNKNVIVNVGSDSSLAAGQYADSVVSISGSASSAGPAESQRP